MFPGIRGLYHPSTVVVFGLTAGLTTGTLPARSPSGPLILAGRPTLIEPASFTGTLVRVTTREVSTIETSGVPLAGISPGYTGRSATMPLMGLAIFAEESCVLAFS